MFEIFLFKFVKSAQNLHVPDFIRTIAIGDVQALWLFSRIP